MLTFFKNPIGFIKLERRNGSRGELWEIFRSLPRGEWALREATYGVDMFNLSQNIPCLHVVNKSDSKAIVQLPQDLAHRHSRTRVLALRVLGDLHCTSHCDGNEIMALARIGARFVEDPAPQVRLEAVSLLLKTITIYPHLSVESSSLISLVSILLTAVRRVVLSWERSSAVRELGVELLCSVTCLNPNFVLGYWIADYSAQMPESQRAAEAAAEAGSPSSLSFQPLPLCLADEGFMLACRMCTDPSPRVRAAALRSLPKYPLGLATKGTGGEVCHSVSTHVLMHALSKTAVPTTIMILPVQTHGDTAISTVIPVTVTYSRVLNTVVEQLWDSDDGLADAFTSEDENDHNKDEEEERTKKRKGEKVKKDGGNQKARRSKKKQFEKQRDRLSEDGWMGALVHGYEDEFVAVRFAAVYATLELTLAINHYSRFPANGNTRYQFGFAQRATEFLVDMFNDEEEIVRVSAVKALSRMHSAANGDSDAPCFTETCPSLVQVLLLLDDCNDITRCAALELLPKLPLITPGDIGCVVTHIVDTSLKKFPSDASQMVKSIRELAQRHAPRVMPRDLSSLLSRLDLANLQTFAQLDNPHFRILMGFLHAALTSRPGFCLSDLPLVFGECVEYLEDRFPHEFPPLQGSLEIELRPEHRIKPSDFAVRLGSDIYEKLASDTDMLVLQSFTTLFDGDTTLNRIKRRCRSIAKQLRELLAKLSDPQSEDDSTEDHANNKEGECRLFLAEMHGTCDWYLDVVRVVDILVSLVPSLAHLTDARSSSSQEQKLHTEIVQLCTAGVETCLNLLGAYHGAGQTANDVLRHLLRLFSALPESIRMKERDGVNTFNHIRSNNLPTNNNNSNKDNSHEDDNNNNNNNNNNKNNNRNCNNNSCFLSSDIRNRCFGDYLTLWNLDKTLIVRLRAEKAVIKLHARIDDRGVGYFSHTPLLFRGGLVVIPIRVTLSVHIPLSSLRVRVDVQGAPKVLLRLPSSTPPLLPSPSSPLSFSTSSAASFRLEDSSSTSTHLSVLKLDMECALPISLTTKWLPLANWSNPTSVHKIGICLVRVEPSYHHVSVLSPNVIYHVQIG